VVAAVLAMTLDLSATGCVSLPRSGAVRSSSGQDAGDGDTLVDYSPPGPSRGADRMQIVDGFLTAMTATPLNTYVAREFLTAASSRSWVPEQGTVVYGSQQQVTDRTGVRLRLRDVVELDARGAWLADPTSGRGHEYSLHLVKERGQWRIGNPPDRLLIPRTHFDGEYAQSLLYFFDPTAQVLVPEPVYVPRGRQAPTLLTTALLKGPEPYLRGVERTFVPPGATLDGVSVPVSPTGTVEVPLSAEVLDVGNRQLNLMYAQLAWTLGQLPGVRRLRVTVGGTPIDLPGGGKDLSVDAWSKYDPSVAWASTELFGIRDDRVVAVSADKEQRVSGPFGVLRLGLRSIAVDLLAQQIAGVSGDGRRVLEADRDGVPGKTATLADVRTVYRAGTDLLRPSYDVHGQLWLVDDTAQGARVEVVHGSDAEPVAAPGLDGQLVSGFAVSRDGTRLVARVAHGGRQEILLSRVARDEHGRVSRLTPAHRVPVAGPPASVRDVAWRSPADLAVLVRPTQATSQVLVTSVDGSATAALSSRVEPLPARGRRVVASPSQGTPLWVLASGAAAGGHSQSRLFGFSHRGNWTRSGIGPGLRAPTFVG
jgi:hypothetical protein